MRRKNKPEKKKQRRLSRVELASELGVGLTSVDRLIARGLGCEGRRGRAKLYDPAAARRLAEELAPKEELGVEIMVASWNVKADDQIDRYHRMVVAWIDETEVRERWRHVVVEAARMTADFPEAMARRVGGVEPRSREAALLSWALERPLGNAIFGVVDYLVVLARAITDTPRPPEIDTDAEPSTIAEARHRWLKARGLNLRQRIAIRDGHRKRAEISGPVDGAVWGFRRHWLTWLSQVEALAGDEDRALDAARALRQDALETLTTLDGTLAARPPINSAAA